MKRAIHKLSAVLLVIMLMTQTFGSALAAVTSNTITAPEVVDSPSGEGGQIQAVLVQVSFYGHDGTLLKTASVEAGGSYDPGQWPAAPQREGYDFVGWSDGSAIVTSLENLQADVTLTAQYAQLFTITFENWDGTELAVLDGIRAGTHIVPADYYGGVTPERESFVFDHWEPSDIPSLDADTTVTAVFSHLSQHTITINYVFQNQKQAAPPFIAVVSHGYQFTQTVPSPAILGYTPDPAEVQITDPITEDVTIDVIYHPNGTTRYWVAHLQQELDGSYTEVEREERYGETGSLTNVTLADVKSYEGFFLYTNLNLVNNEIAADETTVIELQYDRSIHYVLFDTADGTYIEPQVAPFGTPVVTPANPTRAGYTFNRWDKPIPATIGSSDVTITAQWTPQTVGYTIVVWRENANDTNFSYATTLTGSTALAGSTVTNFTRDSSITDSEKGYFTFSHADPVIIKGDGSSVQNVYYSRNSYNAKFVLADSGTHLIAGGTTYNKSGGSTHVDYEFTAKYGAAITHLWPSYVGPDSKNFRGWSAPGASSTYTSARLTFTPELLDRTFTALYDGSCRDTLTYMLETPDGTGTAYTYQGTTRYYNAAPELAQTVYSERGSWGLKEITGFVGQNVVTVITAGSTQRPTARNITLYYTRNENTITYHNGDNVHSTDPIFFDADISSYNIANPPRPSGIPQDYEFRGWYTNPNFYENSKVNWAGAKMPANGLIVYASWQKPIYDVVFDLNFEGGGVHAVNHTVKGDTTEPVTNPTRPGYHFNYWYYIENGVQKLFTFSMPITRNYDLFASWTPTAVRYTVRYVNGDVGGPVYDQSGTVIGDKIGEDLVSATVTENAVPSYNAQGEPVYPDRRTSSLALQANENVNIITFTYRRANVVYYLVRYVDNQGNEIADTKGPVSTTPTTVTERYRSIPGYSPTVYQQTITLAHETNPNNVQQNIITFVYNPNSQTRYIVRHYLQNVDNNQYTLDEELTFTNAAVGSRVHADPKTYTGFHYMSVLSVDNGVVSSNQDNPLVLSLYYNRSIVAYSASYLDEYDSQKLAPDTTGLARYGKQITLIAKDIPSYLLDADRSPSPQTITIGVDPAANHVDFFYKLRDDLAVTVRFLDENGDAIAQSHVYTSGDDRNIKLGATYAYTLAAGENTIEFNGEIYHHAPADPSTKSLTIVEGDNYLDFHYAPETYTVTYDANGGSGAPTDDGRYRVNSQVAVKAGTPAYGENQFVGWSMSSSVEGRVYDTQAELDAVPLVSNPFTMPRRNVVLYAVWSHLTSTLSYASDTPYEGTLPAGGEVPINTPVPVAGGDTISREGYTFAGWREKDGSGQLVGPTYGPGTGHETISINKNTTLYTTWTPIQYAIRYESNLPAAAQARWTNPNPRTSYTVESSDYALADPSSEGYDFLGWYTDDTYQTLAPSPALPQGSTGDRTYYAKFQVSSLDGLRVDGYTGVYDGDSHGVTFVDEKGQLIPGDVVEYSTPNKYTDVTGGPVEVTVTVKRDGEVIWTGTNTVTITPRTVTLRADNINVIYDGQTRSLAVTLEGAAKPADEAAILGALTYTLGGSPVANSFTDAMPTTTVTVSATHPNYIIHAATPTVTIARRVVTITADSLLGQVYNGQPYTVSTWTVAPPTQDTGLVDGDAIATVVLTDNTRTEVGTSCPHPSGAVLSAGKAQNYDFHYVDGVLEVVQSGELTLALSAGAGSYVYDGQPHGFTADTQGVPVTLEYRIGSGEWQTVTAANPLPSYTEAGSYPLTVRASNPNYSNVPTATATLVITPRPVTLRAGSGSFPYDGAVHTVNDWSVDPATADTGLVGADTITEVTLTDNSRSAMGSNPIGIAVKSWSAGVNPGNYAVSTVQGSIEILQSAGSLGVHADDSVVTYDGNEHRLTYQPVGVPEGTPYTVWYSTDGGSTWTALREGEPLPGREDAGTYEFDLKITSPNYADEGFAKAKLTIQRRAVTLTAGTSLGNVYTGNPYTVTYSASPEAGNSGLLAGDDVTAVLNGASQTEAGAHAVTFEGGQTVIRRGSAVVTDNYQISYEDGLIEILKASSQASGTSAAYVYNGTAHGYTAPVLTDGQGNALTGFASAWSATPLWDEDAPGWNPGAFPTETEVKSAAVDAYQIYVRLTHPNYETKIVMASLTITPAPVTLTADSGSFPYTLLPSGDAKVWSIDNAHWQIAGLPQDTLYAGDTITYTLQNNTRSEVGGHAVTFLSFGITDPAHAKNYIITTVNGRIDVVRGAADTEMTAQGLNTVYDAQPHPLPHPVVTVEDEQGNPQDRTSDFAFTYVVTKDGGEPQTYTTLPEFTEAGEYKVEIKATSDVYKEPEGKTVTVVINPRPLILTSETASYPYDALEHSVAVLESAAGYAPNTNHAVDAAALAMKAGQVNAATLAGTYPVEIDLASVKVFSGARDVSANYAIQIVPGSLTITPTQVTAAQLGLTDVTVVYDAQGHSLAMPASITLASGEVIDLTDTSRFTFSYKELDLLDPSAVEMGSPTNPSYISASQHRVTVQITDLAGSLIFEAASAKVTVTKRDVTITPDSGVFTYDGLPKTVTDYTAERAAAGGSTGLVGADDVTVTLVGNTRTEEGSNDITWINPTMSAGDANNYNFLMEKGKITVNAADQLIVTVTADSHVYDGRSHGYTFTTNETDASKLTLRYSTDGGATWTPFTSASELPAYTDADSYPLLIHASSPNFAKDGEGSATLVITPRPVAITPEDATFDYDGTLKTLTDYTVEKADVDAGGLPVGNRGLLGWDSVTATLTNNAHTNAGQYTVGSRDAAAATPSTRLSNYAFEYTTGTLTILKAKGLQITLNADSSAYDSLFHGYTFSTNAVGEYTLEYSLDGGVTWTEFTTAADLPSHADVGSYPLTVRVSNPNYETPTATASATLDITPVDLVLAVESKSFVYDGNPHSLVLKVVSGLVGDDALDVYTLNPASRTDAGIYPVEAVQGDTVIASPHRAGNQIGNYNVTFTPGVLTIVDFDVEDYEGDYDGDPHSVGVVIPPEFEDEYIVTYTPNGGAPSPDNPEYTDTGDNTVTVTLTPKDPDSGLPTFSKDGKVKINPKSITLLVDSINKTYDGTYSALTVTLPQGAAATQADEEGILGSLVFSANSAAIPNAFINAGATHVTVSSTWPNYIITPVNTTAQIAKRMVTFTAGSATKVYDELPVTVDYTTDAAQYDAGGAVTNATGLLRNHTTVATLIGATRTEVCTEAPVTFLTADTYILEAGQSVLANYDVHYVNGKITITPPQGLVLTLAEYDGVYDGQPHGVSVVSVMDGSRPVDLSNFTWTFGETEATATSPSLTRTNAGELTVYVKGVSKDGNYPTVTGSALLKIRPRPVLVTPDDGAFTYDGTTHTVSGYDAERATAGNPGRGLVDADSVTVTLENNSQILPGVYTITWKDPVMTTGLLDNYELIQATGTLTIAKATSGLTISVNDDTLPYDALEHRLTYNVTAPPGALYTVEYSIDNGQSWVSVGSDGPLPGNTDAGSYPVKVRVTSPYFEDGYVSSDEATLTLNQRLLTIKSETGTYVYDKTRHTVEGLWQLTPSTASAGLVENAAHGILHSIGSYSYAQGKDNAQTEVGGHDVLVNAATVKIVDQDANDVTRNYIITTEAGSIQVTPQGSSAQATEKTVQYNGQPHDFTLPTMKDADGNEVTEPVTYSYSVDGVNWSDTPITYEDVVAGGYTIYVKAQSPNYEPVVTTAKLIITPAPLTITADTKDDFIYTLDAGGNPVVWSVDTVSVTAGTLYKGETVDFTLRDNTQSQVGEHAVILESAQVMLGGKDVSDNYRIQLQNGHIKVSQGTADAYMTAIPLTGVYKSEDYTLTQPTVSVQAATGEYVDKTAEYDFEYVVTKDGNPVGTFTGTLPHFTDVGVYEIAITATSSQLTSPVTGSTTMTITKRPITIASGDNSAAPYTYNGQEQSVAPHVVDPGTPLAGQDGISAYAFEAGLSNANTDVCDRDVKLSSVTILNAGSKDVTGNYEITLVPGHIVIKPLHVTGEGRLILLGETHVYDGGPHSATLSDQLLTSIGAFSIENATVPGGTDKRFAVLYSTQAGGTTPANPSFVDVTSQTVTATVVDVTGNMIIDPVSADVIVTRRDVTITPDSGTFPYDGQGHTITTHSHPKAVMVGGVAVGTTGLVGDDDVTVTLVNNGPHIVPGEYTISWTDPVTMLHGKAGNYNFLHDTGKLTITKATGLDLVLTAQDVPYDGLPHGYTVSPGPNVPPGTPVTFQYKDPITGDWVTVDENHPLPSHVNAGDYPLTVRITSPYYSDEAEDTKTLTIRRRPVTLYSGDNHLAPYTYDGTEKSVEPALVLASTPLANGDSIDPAGNTFEPGFGNTNIEAVDRPVRLNGAVIRNAANEDVTANYSVTFLPGRIVINKAGSSVTPGVREETYAGTPYAFNAPQLKDASGQTVTGVSYAYSLVPLDAGSADWIDIAAFPTQEEVKRTAGGSVDKYVIYVRVSHPNYGTQTTTSTLTILPAAIEVTAGSGDFVYTLDASGNPKTWTVSTYNLTGGTLYKGAALSATLRNNTRAIVGENAVFVDTVKVMFGTQDLTHNYSISTKPGSIKVNKGTFPSQITALGDTVEYDGKGHTIPAPIVSVQSEDGSVWIDRTGDFTLTYDVRLAGSSETQRYTKLSDIKLVNVGTYHITVNATSEMHADPASVIVDLVITPKPLTITSGNNSAAPYTYNGKTQSVKGDAVVDGLISGHTLRNLTYAPGKHNTSVNVSDREVLLSGVTVMNGSVDVTANYTILYNPGRLVIKPLKIPAAKIPVEDVNTQYDGKDHTITVPKTIQTDAGPVDVQEEFIVTYRDKDGNITSTPPAYTDVGEYPVTVILTSKSGNYAPEEVPARVRITKRPLTVTYGQLSALYNGREQSVPVTVTGLVSRDALQLTERNRSSTNVTRRADGTLGALTTTAIRWALTDAVDKAIDRSGNYTVQIVPGSLEIKPIPLTVAVKSEVRTYDGNPHSLTEFTVTGNLIDGDKVTATIAANEALNAGAPIPVGISNIKVTTSATGKDVTGNYLITPVPGTLTIKQVTLALFADDLTVVYDGLSHEPDVIVQGVLKNGDTLANYKLDNMPKTEIGRWRNVTFDRSKTVILNTKGENVTANYRIRYMPGSLTIIAPSTTYTVRYYYDGVQDGETILTGTRGTLVTNYPPRLLPGYVLDRTENLPLKLTRDPANNIISVYYRTASVKTLSELLAPWSGSTSYERGTAID